MQRFVGVHPPIFPMFCQQNSVLTEQKRTLVSNTAKRSWASKNMYWEDFYHKTQFLINLLFRNYFLKILLNKHSILFPTLEKWMVAYQKMLLYEISFEILWRDCLYCSIRCLSRSLLIQNRTKFNRQYLFEWTHCNSKHSFRSSL